MNPYYFFSAILVAWAIGYAYGYGAGKVASDRKYWRERYYKEHPRD